MNLRSGRSISFGNSKVSTQGSGTKAPTLDPIFEDKNSSETDTTSSESMASFAMGETSNLNGKGPKHVHYKVPLFNVKLVYIRDNLLGAHLYVDPLNTTVVKMGPDIGRAKPKKWVMAMFQNDRYIDNHGVVYLITPSYENMNSLGVINYTRAQSEPPAYAKGNTLGEGHARRTQSAVFAPTAPPLPKGYEATKGIYVEPEVSSKPTISNVSSVLVMQILIDQEHIVLYKNHVGVYYKTPASPTQFYPFENVINVYHNLQGHPIVLEDDHKN